MYTSRISDNGMITIPPEIVEKYNLSVGDTVEWILEDDHVLIKFHKQKV